MTDAPRIRNISPGRKPISGSLGRKFALVLLPLVVIPLLLLGGVAYWRMSSILRQEAIHQVIYAIDARTRNTPVILLFPPDLSEVQIHQLLLWTNHCRERAAFPAQEFYDKLFAQLANQ